jgi:hypothetical protein
MILKLIEQIPDDRINRTPEAVQEDGSLYRHTLGQASQQQDPQSGLS